jgi:hypothetical protein
MQVNPVLTEQKNIYNFELKIETAPEYQWSISNDLIEAGYVFQEFDNVSYLRIDTYQNREFMQKRIRNFIRLEIVNKIAENILNMVNYDFVYYFEK